MANTHNRTDLETVTGDRGLGGHVRYFYLIRTVTALGGLAWRWHICFCTRRFTAITCSCSYSA